MIEEALKRMWFLKLHKSCINAFKKGKVWKSEYGMGALFESDEVTEKIISNFEEKYGGVVYHVIKEVWEIYGSQMTLYHLLYVSKYDEEWKSEWNDMKNGVIFGYVFNEGIPEYSEFGTFYVKPIIGGLTVSDKPYTF